MLPPLFVLARNEIGTKRASLPIFNLEHRLGEGAVVLIDGLLILWLLRVLERGAETNRNLESRRISDQKVWSWERNEGS